MTVQQLADKLDLSEKVIRHWLREYFPTSAPGQGRQWEVTPRMERFCEQQAARRAM